MHAPHQKHGGFIMRIQHNIAAMNSYRNYTANNRTVAKNLEKLSSGYRINRAGDDAAGLAISEKMRAQITGLETAQKNAKDGISLVQTAEGALTEVHSMLNRMTELADQSANGTYDNEVDRANLAKEVDQLKSEINRIADSTNFNGIKLLDGSLAAKSEAAISEEQVMTIQAQTEAADGTVTKVGSAGEQGASAAKQIFGKLTADLAEMVDDGTFDTFTISFTNKAGKEKTITLVETAVDAMASTGAGLASALKGENTNLSLSSSNNNPDDLAEFRELFDIGSSTGAAAVLPGTPAQGQYVTFQAKDVSSGAKITSFKAGGHADNVNTALTSAKVIGEDGNSLKAESAGYAVDFNTGTDAAGLNGTGNTLTAGTILDIGGNKYEVIAANGTAKDGNIGVTIGGTDKGTVENLAAQLKKDGYEVEISKNDATKLLFTNKEQFTEKQKGAQISSSSNNIQLNNKNAVKEKTQITMGSTTAGDQTATINYTNAKGESKSKTITYTGSATEDDNVANLKKVLAEDAELNTLFKIENNAAVLTIEARGTGAGSGSFKGMELSDTTATQIVTQTAGSADGKELTFKSTDIKTGALQGDNLGTNLKEGDTITVNGKTYQFTKDKAAHKDSKNTLVDLGANLDDTLKTFSDQLTKDGIHHTWDKAAKKMTFEDNQNVMENVEKGGLSLQIGDTADDFNQLTVSVDDMHTEALGLNAVDISTQDGAKAAVSVIKNAINSVSSTRGTLGATQNRLEHTMNNLSVQQENTQDAESGIRDVDVAAEMMKYTKNNILVQSAQAMLAQANQAPQGVLQLLG